MKTFSLLVIAIVLSVPGCIGDDFIMTTVDPILRITSQVDTIAVDSSYTFTSMYLNNVGIQEMVNVEWSSSDQSVIEISTDGIARALKQGSSIISVQYFDSEVSLRDSIEVHVGNVTVSTLQSRMGTANTTSSYALKGDFVLREVEGSNDLTLEFFDDYVASSSLPGLFIYLSNNNNTVAGALEIGAVTTFSGAHSYTIQDVGINDYTYVLFFCKPFNVKVGDGEIL